MESVYKAKLRCATCGDTESFEWNEDKSYIKCNKCGREYFNGYNELVEYNQEAIENTKDEIKADVEDYVRKAMKDAFKGCKNIKLT